jgi:hypothetical protein
MSNHAQTHIGSLDNGICEPETEANNNSSQHSSDFVNCAVIYLEVRSWLAAIHHIISKITTSIADYFWFITFPFIGHFEFIITHQQNLLPQTF